MGADRDADTARGVGVGGASAWGRRGCSREGERGDCEVGGDQEEALKCC